MSVHDEGGILEKPYNNYSFSIVSVKIEATFNLFDLQKRSSSGLKNGLIMRCPFCFCLFSFELCFHLNSLKCKVDIFECTSFIANSSVKLHRL